MIYLIRLVVISSLLFVFSLGNGEKAMAFFRRVPQAQIKGRIIFTSDRSGESGWWVYQIDSSGEMKKLVEGIMHSHFSPDSKRLFFIRSKPHECAQIWTATLEGKDEHQISNFVSSSEFGSPWGFFLSPDGNKIAFVSVEALCILDIESKEIKKIVDKGIGSVMCSVSSPAWSPDGKKIAFSGVTREAYRKDMNSKYEIFIVNIDGSGLKQMTHNPHGDSGPAWSPEGKKIAFASWRKGNKSKEIYIMDADGTNLKKVTNNRWDDTEPVWSPDGKEILFVSHRGGLWFARGNLFIINTDGTNERWVTKPEIVPGTRINCTDEHPDWAE